MDENTEVTWRGSVTKQGHLGSPTAGLHRPKHGSKSRVNSVEASARLIGVHWDCTGLNLQKERSVWLTR